MLGLSASSTSKLQDPARRESASAVVLHWVTYNAGTGPKQQLLVGLAAGERQRRAALYRCKQAVLLDDCMLL
jgi:hypothetical protein